MIDVNEPLYNETDLKHIIRNKSVEDLEEKFCEYLGTKYAVACSSGSAAIHMAILACGVRKHDHVIVSPMAHFSSIASIIMTGAHPSFSDVDDYCNLNPKILQPNIKAETSALLVNHSFGHACQIDFLNEIADQYELPLIEDCRDALGSEVRDRKVGTFGDVSCFSFSNTGVIEGGIIATDRYDIYRKCRKLRNHGLSEKSFIHSILGFNYKMSKIAASIAYHYISPFNAILTKVISNSEYIIDNMSNKFLRILTKRYKLKTYKNSYGWLPILTANRQTCARFKEHLDECGITYKFQYFHPMNTHPAVVKHKCFSFGELSNASSMAGRFVGIPNNYCLKKEDMDKLIECLNNFDPIGEPNVETTESSDSSNKE